MDLLQVLSVIIRTLVKKMAAPDVATRAGVCHNGERVLNAIAAKQLLLGMPSMFFVVLWDQGNA